MDFSTPFSANPSATRPPSLGSLASPVGRSDSLVSIGSDFSALISDQLTSLGARPGSTSTGETRPSAPCAQAEACTSAKASNKPAPRANAGEGAEPERTSPDTTAPTETEGSKKAAAPEAPPADPALWAAWWRGATPNPDKGQSSAEGLAQAARELGQDVGPGASLYLDPAHGARAKGSAGTDREEQSFEALLSAAQTSADTESGATKADLAGPDLVSGLNASQDSTSVASASDLAELAAQLKLSAQGEPSVAAGSDGARSEVIPFQDRLSEAMEGPLFRPSLGTKISVMVKEGIEQARLQLNPAEMGPVAIRLARDGQKVRVDFAADLALTRHTLEQAMPALAVALKEAGFTLSGGSVTAPQDTSSGLNTGHPGHSPQAQSDPQGSRGGQGSATSQGTSLAGTDEAEGLATPSPEATRRPRSLGEVDLFA